MQNYVHKWVNQCNKRHPTKAFLGRLYRNDIQCSIATRIAHFSKTNLLMLNYLSDVAQLLSVHLTQWRNSAHITCLYYILNTCLNVEYFNTAHVVTVHDLLDSFHQQVDDIAQAC